MDMGRKRFNAALFLNWKEGVFFLSPSVMCGRFANMPGYFFLVGWLFVNIQFSYLPRTGKSTPSES